MKLSQTSSVKSLDRGLEPLEDTARWCKPPSFSQFAGERDFSSLDLLPRLDDSSR